MRGRAARQEADNLADRMLGTGGRAAEPVAVVLAECKRRPLPEAFAVQLVHRLRDQDPRVGPALVWLDQRLAAQATTADEVVRAEHQRQGAASVTVRNIITSMRLISDVDWTELFERISLVDEALADDSGFRDMDFPTRNLYRSAIEELARGSKRAELEVARSAVLAAKQARSGDGSLPEFRCAETGYHLLGGGRRAFEALIGFRLPVSALPGRFNRALGISGYVAAIVAVGALLLALPLVCLSALGLAGAGLLLLGALGAIPAIDAAVALVNRVVTGGFGATLLPALELPNGVPPHLRTLVAVPTFLTSQEAIEEQVKRLEIHYLASSEGDLHFALLSDWADATTENVEGDGALLAAAERGIARLNQPLDPGYIKGYPPGIRENGGQYTHAALWSVMAFAALGDADKAAKLFALLNPINNAATRADVHRYKVEPYVVAADVYSKPPHIGRGGWTWYTGSAAWMQRAGIESILGLRVMAMVLHLDPCIPKGWRKYEMTLRHKSARYEILVENPDGVSGGVFSAQLNGTIITDRPLRLPLLDDGVTHQVQVRLG